MRPSRGVSVLVKPPVIPNAQTSSTSGPCTPARRSRWRTGATACGWTPGSDTGPRRRAGVRGRRTFRSDNGRLSGKGRPVG
jgi:hypothetical protein